MTFPLVAKPAEEREAGDRHGHAHGQPRRDALPRAAAARELVGELVAALEEVRALLDEPLKVEAVEAAEAFNE